MRIAIAQLDPVVGAFEANVKKIKEAYKRACSKQARLLLTPELGICGYPPHDLVNHPEMIERNEKAVEDLRAFTLQNDCALIVGHIAANPSDTGRLAQNVATVLQKGQRVFRQAKTLLPTYDVFDEARYFEPAQQVQLWVVDSYRIAIALCEDLWAHDPVLQRRIYGQDPVDQYREMGANLILSISASPYLWNKRRRCEELHQEISKNLKAPLIYVNQVGATDEILFDGGSFALDTKGQMSGRLPIFKKSFGLIELKEAPGFFSEMKWIAPDVTGTENESPAEIEVLYRALITGIREYFERTGFKTAILGLSGGIDSSVVAVLASHALGSKNVLGVAMPSQYSSSESLTDAELLSRNLGIRFEVKPIKFSFSVLSRELSEGRGALAAVASENLQSRLRGMILMTLANHHGSLVLTTGNKSELATGYCTLYGDLCGALAPIGDVLKTRVYELARYINQTFENLIPERCLTKAPSAELRPNQTDQDTLPPYEILDAILTEYVEKNNPAFEIESILRKDHPQSVFWIKDILKRIEANEFKRRQAPPVLKISPCPFGIGRRIPIAKSWSD